MSGNGGSASETRFIYVLNTPLPPLFRYILSNDQMIPSAASSFNHSLLQPDTFQSACFEGFALFVLNSQINSFLLFEE